MPATPASRSLLVVALVTVAGCEPTERPLSHEADIAPLWDAKCGDCHMDGHAFGGLFLDRGYAYENLVGAPASQLPAMHRVEPGAPWRSYLWLKLLGVHDHAGGYGEPIPVVWTARERARVRTWIAQGAAP